MLNHISQTTLRSAQNNERRLRRLAKRHGLVLRKARFNDDLQAHGYAPYFVADENNWLLTSEFGMTLAEVEDWLLDAEAVA